MEKSFNPIKLAIENYNYVYERFLKKLIEKGGNEVLNAEKSTRARSREILSLMQDLGLIGCLSYYYGKSEEKYYDLLIKILEEGLKEKDAEEIFKETKTGYATILYLVLKGIQKLNMIEVNLEDPYKSIIELSKEENLNKVAIIEKLLIPYLIEIKRLCEGTLRSETK